MVNLDRAGCVGGKSMDCVSTMANTSSACPCPCHICPGIIFINASISDPRYGANVTNGVTLTARSAITYQGHIYDVGERVS